MPTSFHKHITYVMDKVIELKPKSVLDIGIGFGKWGSLCREYLDIYGNGDVWKKKDWKTKIYGVEIFKPYLDEFKHLHYIYDKIINCNIKDYVFNNIELVMIMDVFEHLEEKEAVSLFEKWLEYSNNIIMSVPLGDFRYEYNGENKAESHLSMWTVEKLTNSEPFKKYYKEHKIFPLTTSGGREIEVGVFLYKRS